MFNLGALAKEVGNGAGAVAWWEHAAANGHAHAMFNLGVLAKWAGYAKGARS
jgi:hypothetical protein